eukprot:TRINITY_DN66483_c8_g3_i2.p1 TRINITY_DN66483_c8_g3~~TRINITY_DN66483_c8_g3_i2.p1  ORF type:complete len:741 (+),score=104.90 TRINITY_DN66483_c8_g3_i2:70-2292(+)
MAQSNKEWAKYTFERKQRSRGPHPSYPPRPPQGTESDDDSVDHKPSHTAPSSNAEAAQYRAEFQELRTKTVHQLTEAAERNRTLENNLNDSTRDLRQLQEQYSSLTAKLRDAQDANQRLQNAAAQNDGLEARLRAQIRAELESQLREQITKEVTTTTTTVVDEEATRLKREKAVLLEEKQRLKQLLDEERDVYKNGKAALELELRKLREANDKVQRELIEITTTTTTNTNLSVEERKRLMDEFDRERQKWAADKARLDDELHAIRRDNHVLDESHRRIQAENHSLTEQVRRLQSLTPPPGSPQVSLSKLRAQEEKNEELANKLTELSAKLASLQNNVNERSSAENEMLKTRLEELLNQKNMLQLQAEDYARQLTERTNQAKELMEQNELLQKAAREATDNSLNLENRLQTAQLTITTLESDLAGTMAQLGTAKEELARLAEENKLLDTDNRKLLEELRKAQAALQEANQSKKQLEEQLQQIKHDAEVQEQVIVEIRGKGYRADLLRKVYHTHLLVEGLMKMVRQMRNGDQYTKYKRAPHPNDYVQQVDRLYEDLTAAWNGGAQIISLYFTDYEKLTVGLSTEAYKQQQSPHSKPLPLNDVVTTTTRITAHGIEEPLGASSPGRGVRAASPTPSGGRLSGTGGSRSPTPAMGSPPAGKGRPISPEPVTSPNRVPPSATARKTSRSPSPALPNPSASARGRSPVSPTIHKLSPTMQHYAHAMGPGAQVSHSVLYADQPPPPQ